MICPAAISALKVLGASEVQKPEEESPGRRLKPVMDEYVRSESQEPSGRYWMGKDEDGQPKIYFDDQSRAEDAPKQPEGKKDKDETWECNTDRVDREIEKLKKKQQELKRKDNDTYRERNASFTQLS